MKKRTKEILSGVLALGVVLGTPEGMAAAEPAGQQQEAVLTDDGRGMSVHSSESVPEDPPVNAPEVFPGAISGTGSESLLADALDTLSGQTLEEMLKDTSGICESISESLPCETPEEGSESGSEVLADSEGMTEPFADRALEILADETEEAASESISEIHAEAEYLPDMPEDESNVQSEAVSGNKSEIPADGRSDGMPEDESDMKSLSQSEAVPEVMTEDESESRSESEPEQIPENASETESEEISGSKSETESEEISGSRSEPESEQIPENASETESEEISGSKSETESEEISGSKSETESEQIPESSLETESEQISESVSEEISGIEPETDPEESAGTKTGAGSSDGTIYIKEADSNTAADPEEQNNDAPILKELWVESECPEIANVSSGQFLAKDFVLRGTFYSTASRINRIEYTTDLQAEDKSVWLEAESTQTAESKTSAAGFQIALPDGTYPSIAIRAYDEAGNISGVGQLVNDSGESIKVVIDSTSGTTGMTAQNQSPAQPAVKRTIKLKTANLETAKSEAVIPEISNPDNPNQGMRNPEVLEQEIKNPEVLEQEIGTPEAFKPEITGTELLKPENSDMGVASQETSKAGIPESKQELKQELKQESPTSENAKSDSSYQEDVRRKAVKSELLKPESAKQKPAELNVIEQNTAKTELTRPEIHISFNDSNAAGKNIYRQKRTATVRVQEPDFDPGAVSLSVTKDNKPFEVLLSDWTSEGSEHYATFELSEEGEYSIAANSAGLAGQTETFIIDRIAPKMTMELVPVRKTQEAVNTALNNAVSNDSFNTGVTAVIRVTEHNFREEDFTINMASVSEKGTWSHDGDVHTLRIPFDGDDAYHIECAYADLYGNSVKTLKKDFLIDTAAPAITIEGVAHNSANNSAVHPVISVADSNMDLSDISVSVVTGTGELVQCAVDTELVSSENGASWMLALTDITEQPDNVYHLLVSASDKAGNVSERTCRFSLNRNGSVYDLTALRHLVDQKYSTYGALEDIRIAEMNMDAVEEFDLYISRNGALGYRAEYTKEASGSADAGYTYLYRIKKENFVEEGTYRLTMYSRDRAGNEVNNAADINGEEITFVVDNTAPKVVIDGVSSGMVYEVEEQKVHVTVMDNFKLEEAELFLVNEADEVLERWDYIALAGEDCALDITIPQHDGKLSLLYRVKDATGNEIQALRGDTAAPVDFIVNARKPVTVFRKFRISLMTVMSALAVALLSAITMKKRHKRTS